MPQFCKVPKQDPTSKFLPLTFSRISSTFGFYNNASVAACKEWTNVIAGTLCEVPQHDVKVSTFPSFVLIEVSTLLFYNAASIAVNVTRGKPGSGAWCAVQCAPQTHVTARGLGGGCAEITGHFFRLPSSIPPCTPYLFETVMQCSP